MLCNGRRPTLLYEHVQPGVVLHLPNGAAIQQCRRWLVMGGWHLDALQVREAARLMEIDDDGKITGPAANIFADYLRLFHEENA